ncbi:tannase/feruloyl esterase family alpha/beta hydrolase [Actinomadura sp. B10D3]|uniref:tannase/feruloyl esterase family alpha/beta hydrolase n=1 Tax=Actinomadura sp. B10D3 TaxID=3153557 RepID=UPI00325EA595
MACERLETLDLSGLRDAPTRIISAIPEEHCLIKGYVSPQVEFELRLPTGSWNGRYLQLGCGGLCGTVQPDDPMQHLPGGCAPPDDGGTAIASGGGGHTGAGSTDGLWAHSDPQLRVDFGYRSEHVIALASKAIIKAYYGQAPRYSYFNGCSNGGRQALMEAQRFPDDFDGIIAGAPSNMLTALSGELLPWNARVNKGADGRQILDPDKLPFLHREVMAACDPADGLKDGLIDDPRNCRFDPAALRCTRTQQDCLTAEEVDVVRKLYGGPVDRKGRRLYPSGLPLGSEAAWRDYVIAPAGKTSILGTLGLNYLKYMSSWTNPPSSFTLDDHRFDITTFKKLRRMSGIYDSADPDLTRYRDRGGKLILWHGWADPGIPAQSTIAYYHAVTERMGGLKATQEFARLFLFPGVYHCASGHGPHKFDLFNPLYDWVEKGTSPHQIIAADTREGQKRTRPVYPYPMQAKYTGTGSIDDAANFKGVMPKNPPDDTYPWLGAPLRSGYQKWCHWNGRTLECEPKK